MSTAEVRTIGGQHVLVPRPLLTAAFDIADELLMQAPTFKPALQVLVLGAGCAVPVAVSRCIAGTPVLVADHRLHMLDAVRCVAELNGAEVLPIATTELMTLPTGSRDLVLINIAFQPNSVRLLELLRVVCRLVRPAGRVYLAGARARGVDSAIRRLGEIFGNAQVAAYRKGIRVAVAVRSAAEAAPAPDRVAPLAEVTLRGTAFSLEPDPGVFARGLLDPATALLVEAMDIERGDKVLDLGCGSGILGMVAAHLAPDGHVWLVDTNTEAIALCRRNLARNRITNATALVSDRVSAVADNRFDVVISNPPFHDGRAAMRSKMISTLEQL